MAAFVHTREGGHMWHQNIVCHLQDRRPFPSLVRSSTLTSPSRGLHSTGNFRKNTARYSGSFCNFEQESQPIKSFISLFFFRLLLPSLLSRFKWKIILCTYSQYEDRRTELDNPPRPCGHEGDICQRRGCCTAGSDALPGPPVLRECWQVKLFFFLCFHFYSCSFVFLSHFSTFMAFSYV